MSVLFKQLTVTANTDSDTPVSVDIESPPMIIRGVSIGFPAGCVDLVHAWVEYQSAQIFPINQDGDFVGNGQIIDFTAQTYIVDEPRIVTFKAYNLDDTYDHKIWLKLDIEFVLPPEGAVNSGIVVSENFPINRA